MRSYAELSALEMWYQRMENMVGRIKSAKWKKIVQKQIAKAATRTVAEHDFPKLSSVKNGQVRIRDNPPLIFHPTEVEAAEYNHLVKEAFRCYRETLPDDLKVLVDRYEIKDVAIKVVGVGSVGTRCAILLMMTGDDDPLFLQVRRCTSVLEPLFRKKCLRVLRSESSRRPTTNAGCKRYVSGLDGTMGTAFLCTAVT
jgi:hypothetical protein